MSQIGSIQHDGNGWQQVPGQDITQESGWYRPWGLASLQLVLNLANIGPKKTSSTEMSQQKYGVKYYCSRL